MIHVLIKPETAFEWLKFHFNGIAPSISCDEIRYGAGIVECIHAQENSCTAVPSDRIIRIIWQGGYSEALAKVKAEFMARIQNKISPDSDSELTETPLVDPAVMGLYS